MSSQFHIPGAYHFDAPASSAPAPLTASIFRPPISPSASTSVVNSVYSEVPAQNHPQRPVLRRPSGGRKRTRDDVTRESTPLTEWAHMGRAETPIDNGGRQIRYTLAGQIETPGSGAVTNPMEAGLEDSVYSDVDYRRGLGSRREYDELASPSERRRSTLENGVVADSTKAPAAQGWTVLGTVGGVVGKVWDFCKGSVFRGFHAGGGRGFEMDASGTLAQEWSPQNAAGSRPTLQTQGPPGQFPSECPPADDLYSPTSDTTPRPAIKRRQVSEAGDELRKNWVMVEEREPRRARSSMPTTTASRPISRKQPHIHQPSHQRPVANRRISQPVSRISTNQHPRRSGNTPRISHTGSPSLTSTASFAAPRSPASPALSSRIPIPAHSTNPFARTASSPRPSSRAGGTLSPPPEQRGHRRNHSNASTASRRQSSRIGVGEIKASPRLDAEAKHLAMGKLAREREADERMDAFSLRLRDMIRQGKEALGTKVEVGEGDEGWMDDG